MFKISFTFFYQFSFSQLFSLVEIALPSISFVETLFAFVSKLWDYFFCKSFVRHKTLLPILLCVDQRENKTLKGSLWFVSFRETCEVDPDQNAVTSYSKVPKHCWVLFLGNGKLMQLWSYDACWSTRKQSAERKSVVYISPRNWGSGSWPKCCDQLFKSTKALLGNVPWKRQTHAIMILWCVLINEKTKRWKEVCGLYLSEKLGKWILTKMLWPAIQKIIQGSLSRLVNCLSSSSICS